MVLVAVLDREAALQVHAQRGAVERGLDVVHRQRVAREQDLDESHLDQARQVAAGARVHDRRPGHDQDPTALAADQSHLAGDGRDHDLLGLLGGDLAAHEAEDLCLA